MIQRCDAYSKIHRHRIEQEDDVSTIVPFQNSIKGSVHEYVRKMDADRVEVDMIEEKFKEAAKFADTEAQKQFKYKRASVLKCVYEFNHHGVRNKQFNGCSSEKCVKCGVIKD